jgi:chromate transport protein ChrA
MMSVWNFFCTVAMISIVSVGGQQVLMVGLEREFVGGGLITAQEYARAIAFGLSTPGPWTAHIASIGLQLHGTVGAMAAVMALICVSMICVFLMSKIPRSFFAHKRVRAGLIAVPAIAAASAVYLGFKVFNATDGQTIVSLLIVAGVVWGMRAKIPAPILVIAAMAIAWISDEAKLKAFEKGADGAAYVACSRSEERPLYEKLIHPTDALSWNLCPGKSGSIESQLNSYAAVATSGLESPSSKSSY